jgi:hypothetical protein
LGGVAWGGWVGYSDQVANVLLPRFSVTCANSRLTKKKYKKEESCILFQGLWVQVKCSIKDAIRKETSQ